MLETHEEWMNRVTTDILDCPECLSEDINELGCDSAEGEDPHIYYFQCRECNHEFEVEQ